MRRGGRRGALVGVEVVVGVLLVVASPVCRGVADASGRVKATNACAVLTQADLQGVTGQQVAERRHARLDDGSTQCVWDLNGGVDKSDPTGGTIDVRSGRFDDAKAQIADTRREATRHAGKTRSVRGIGDAAILAGRDTYSVIIARKGRAIVSIGTDLEVGKGLVAPPAGGFSEREVVRWLTDLGAIALPRA